MANNAPILFGAQDEVCEEDSDGSGGQAHDTRCQRKESESIVSSGREETGHDEVELNKSGAYDGVLADSTFASARAHTKRKNAAEKSSSLYTVNIEYGKIRRRYIPKAGGTWE